MYIDKAVIRNKWKCIAVHPLYFYDVGRDKLKI
jgi:hypothetical protein